MGDQEGYARDLCPVPLFPTLSQRNRAKTGKPGSPWLARLGASPRGRRPQPPEGRPASEGGGWGRAGSCRRSPQEDRTPPINPVPLQRTPFPSQFPACCRLRPTDLTPPAPTSGPWWKPTTVIKGKSHWMGTGFRPLESFLARKTIARAASRSPIPTRGR